MTDNIVPLNIPVLDSVEAHDWDPEAYESGILTVEILMRRIVSESQQNIGLHSMIQNDEFVWCVHLDDAELQGCRYPNLLDALIHVYEQHVVGDHE